MSATMTEVKDAPSERSSTRFSTYSATPTLAPSEVPSRLSFYADGKSSLDTAAYKANMPRNRASYAGPSNRISTRDISVDDAGMIKMAGHLQRLEDKRLQSQRYVVSEGKREEMGRLALGAKLEKALGRRLSAQDAVFTAKKKAALETVKCNEPAHGDLPPRLEVDFVRIEADLDRALGRRLTAQDTEFRDKKKDTLEMAKCAGLGQGELMHGFKVD